MEELTTKPSKTGMSSFTLKMIAIFAMLIDHIAWAFIPMGTLLGQIMHVIGRITAPIMCYFIAEGYYHTHNIKKYALRLGIFAIISHIPYCYFMTGQLPISFSDGFQFQTQTSVIYTLFLGLVSLIIYNNEKLNKNTKIILISVICILAIPGDWSFIAVLWVLYFGINHDDFRKQVLSFSMISIPVSASFLIMLIFKESSWYEQIFQMGVFLAIPLLSKYNGERGGSKNTKWIFYIFYPLHLLILGLIKYNILPRH